MLNKAITRWLFLVVLGSLCPADAALLAQWRLDAYVGGALSGYAAESGLQAGSASMSTSGGGSLVAGTGTTLNALGNPASQSLQFDNGGNKSYTLTFHFTGTGYQDLVLTYADKGNLNSELWQYSTDGVTWSSAGITQPGNAGNSWAVRTVDFTTVTAIENQNSVFFRNTVDINGNKTLDFDNFNIDGVAVVPESTTMALAGFGGFLAVAGVTRRLTRFPGKYPRKQAG